MLRPGNIARILILSVAVLALLAMSGQAQDSKKPSDEDIRKAKDDVAKLRADLDKIEDQYYEAQRKLTRAQDRLAELEGRPRFGPGGFGGRGGFGRGGFSRDRAPAEPPKPPAPPAETNRSSDLDKRLERLLKEVDDLRKDLRRNPPSKD
jgi:hypothetical protein